MRYTQMHYHPFLHHLSLLRCMLLTATNAADIFCFNFIRRTFWQSFRSAACRKFPFRSRADPRANERTIARSERKTRTFLPKPHSARTELATGSTTISLSTLKRIRRDTKTGVRGRTIVRPEVIRGTAFEFQRATFRGPGQSFEIPQNFRGFRTPRRN